MKLFTDEYIVEDNQTKQWIEGRGYISIELEDNQIKQWKEILSKEDPEKKTP